MCPCQRGCLEITLLRGQVRVSSQLWPSVPCPSPRAHLPPGSPSAAASSAPGSPPLVGCRSGRAVHWANWDADSVTQSWSDPPRGDTLLMPSSKCKVLVQRCLGTSPLLTGVWAVLTSCLASQPQQHRQHPAPAPLLAATLAKTAPGSSCILVHLHLFTSKFPHLPPFPCQPWPPPAFSVALLVHPRANRPLFPNLGV